MRPIDRRSFVALGSLTLAGCAREGPYFGNTKPPAGQQLVCAIIGKPEIRSTQLSRWILSRRGASSALCSRG